MFTVRICVIEKNFIEKNVSMCLFIGGSYGGGGGSKDDRVCVYGIRCLCVRGTIFRARKLTI